MDIKKGPFLWTLSFSAALHGAALSYYFADFTTMRPVLKEYAPLHIALQEQEKRAVRKPVVKKISPKPVKKQVELPKPSEPVPVQTNAPESQIETVEVPDSVSEQSSDYVPPNSEQITDNEKPHYPLVARRRGIEGVVLLRVTVGAQGNVLEIKVERSSGHDSLDDSARKSVKKWRFVPARRNGVAVQASVTVPVRFRLANG